ncbi:MAG: hypothetical protein ACRDLK_07290 [Gaiellaceae bacterium]
MAKLHRIQRIPDPTRRVRALVAGDRPVFRDGMVRACACRARQPPRPGDLERFVAEAHIGLLS